MSPAEGEGDFLLLLVEIAEPTLIRSKALQECAHHLHRRIVHCQRAVAQRLDGSCGVGEH